MAKSSNTETKNSKKKEKELEVKKNSKKKIIIIIAIIFLAIGLGITSFFIMSKFAGKSNDNIKQEKVVEEQIYTVDIPADIYKVGKNNHVIKVGLTLFFNSETKRKIYDNVLNPKDPIPEKQKDTLSLGDKIVKDILIETFNELEYNDVNDSEKMKQLLMDKINKKYENMYPSLLKNEKILYNLIFTNYFVK